MIHLICGPIGAGKTTIAHQIAEQYGAIRFSEDEWLSKLFIPDAPQDLMSCSDDIISAWATEKYQRCRGQIWLLCERLLSLGVPVVLDGAAATKEQRDAFRKKASKCGVDFQLHYVTSDSETRKKRVFERNNEKGRTYSIEVTLGMFNMMETFFQPPVADELAEARVVHT